MNDTARTSQASGRRPLRIARADRPAILWAVACCWVAVGGNYLLLSFKLRHFYIVPFDLFVTPLLVTGLFWLIGRLRR
jgi:hypothetical protein